MLLVRCLWLLLAFIWILGEIFLARRVQIEGNLVSNARSVNEHKLWLAVLAGVGLALFFKHTNMLKLPLSYGQAQLIGLSIFFSGIAIRVWAIKALGLFFSTQLQVHQQHQLICRGPYHLVRHPSYSGIVLALLGAGIAMGNALALLALLIPVIWILCQRIHQEEQMLIAKLGTDYEHYKKRTFKLIPWIY